MSGSKVFMESQEPVDLMAISIRNGLNILPIKKSNPIPEIHTSPHCFPDKIMVYLIVLISNIRRVDDI